MESEGLQEVGHHLMPKVLPRTQPRADSQPFPKPASEKILLKAERRVNKPWVCKPTTPYALLE